MHRWQVAIKYYVSCLDIYKKISKWSSLTTLSIMTLSITIKTEALSITKLTIMTLSITIKTEALSITTLTMMTLSITIKTAALSITFSINYCVKCHWIILGRLCSFSPLYIFASSEESCIFQWNSYFNWVSQWLSLQTCRTHKPISQLQIKVWCIQCIQYTQ